MSFFGLTVKEASLHGVKFRNLVTFRKSARRLAGTTKNNEKLMAALLYTYSDDFDGVQTQTTAHLLGLLLEKVSGDNLKDGEYRRVGCFRVQEGRPPRTKHFYDRSLAFKEKYIAKLARVEVTIV